MDPSTSTGAGGTADRSPTAVAGTVVEPRSGVALGRVRVRWLDVKGDELTELAAGLSDDDGSVGGSSSSRRRSTGGRSPTT